MKFEEMGRLVATRAVGDLQTENQAFNDFILRCLSRYSSHDWGDLCEEDKKSNDRAVEKGDERILAAYSFPQDARWIATNMYGGSENKIWIITEWDRSVITILFPGEY